MNYVNNLSVLVFSKNRPMQLMALLESMFANSNIDPRNCHVLYKCSDEYFVPYMEVASSYPEINWIAEWNFNDQVRNFVFNANKFICFLTDDDVFKKQVDVRYCIDAMTNSVYSQNSIAFSLRLGKHLTRCFSTNSSQRLPESFQRFGNGVLAWRYKGTDWDWNYPLSVDGHIFQRDMFMEILNSIPNSWNSPNTFEGLLSHTHPFLKKEWMFCFEESIVFNIPHNKVQKEVDNLHSGGSEKDLLDLWIEGKKIDVRTFQGYINSAAHEQVDFSFINR